MQIEFSAQCPTQNQYTPQIQRINITILFYILLYYLLIIIIIDLYSFVSEVHPSGNSLNWYFPDHPRRTDRIENTVMDCLTHSRGDNNPLFYLCFYCQCTVITLHRVKADRSGFERNPRLTEVAFWTLWKRSKDILFI